MKVIVGLSGGVDSSVCAYLLKKQGYEVIGVTFKTLDDFDPSSAIEISKELDIEYHLIDITKEFKKEIIDDFINEYNVGLTPNPCIICNEKIKFKYLIDAMKEYDADFIATGHYAKIENNNIYKSKDLNKDQSYFLYRIPKDIIPKILFPLEGITKDEVRKIAKDNNLITANKKDSYDVCFIKDNLKLFLDKNIKVKPGNVVDIDSNEVVGKHKGLIYYTIGQRRGLDIGGNDGRLYVVKKDMKNNILYVSLNESNLYSNSCIVTNVNMLTDKKITSCKAKFRYRQNDNDVNIKYLDNGDLEVSYDKIKSVTEGQSCVFYENDLLIGGGIIKSVSNLTK